jgi:hypothetical protein
MPEHDPIFIYRDIHHKEFSDTVTVGQTIAFEIIRNPLRERERRHAEIHSERAKGLEELRQLFQKNQMIVLESAIKILQHHKKRLTQDRLESKSLHINMCEFDKDAFKKISRVAVQRGILTNGTDKHGKGYGLPEWVN